MKHVLIAALLLLAGARESFAESNTAKPNIIVFLVDDMGWQDTSVPFWKEATPLNKTYRTPNMERLAAEGMKFTNAYATPVCTPSRICLMTGASAPLHRVTNWTKNKDTITDHPHPRLTLPEWNVNGLTPTEAPRAFAARALPEWLHKAGYETILAGKAHFGAIGTAGADPRSLGFDVNIAGHAMGSPGSYLGEENYGKNEWQVPGLEKYHGTDTFLTEALTREAIAAAEHTRASGKPFFLYLAHYAVHVPYSADKRFIQKYLDAGMDKTEAMYAALVEGMDKSLGDVMTWLDQQKLTDNTVILFISDNGGLSQHGRGGKSDTHNLPLSAGKGSLREGGIREPMIVKWPGTTKAGSVCETPVMIQDFFPSILEIAGVPQRIYHQPRRRLDGVTFVPLLKGEQGAADRELVWHFPNYWSPGSDEYGPSSAIRIGDWKYIFYHDPANSHREELFNLKDDIGETRNLIKEAPEKANELARALSRALKDVDAQMPVIKETGEAVKVPRGN